ncbi:hypothetical protein IFM89_018227 [Coptis chinensis]|uniref:Ultraviolet-B receptor UVR8 n=1 Tax=Coptis chinensis TaxID=261450 RepID=A0A835I381_9MAGN|nr:hypothetical protein IFM89_018227 [Coptis chinensis]
MAEEGSSEVNKPSRQVVFISAGASHSVALLSGNVVCSWGRGEDGQLGHGDAEDRLLPTQMTALDNLDIVSVTCGADHTTAHSESLLQVYSWGWGDFGRLGHGNSSDVFTPQPVKALQGIRIRQIACGDSHCLAVTMEGEVQSWGRNQNGQLGLGSTEDSLVPQKIQAFQVLIQILFPQFALFPVYGYANGFLQLLEMNGCAGGLAESFYHEGISVKMIAAGAEHTAAVTEDGKLYGWGWGRYGNLGLGDRNDRLVPEEVSPINPSLHLHAVSVIHTSVGTLETKSRGQFGQSVGRSSKPHQITCEELADVMESIFPRGQKMVLVACGWRHTICVSSSGVIYTYGWSKYGQLGHGDFEDHLIPHQLEALRHDFISEVSGGWRHTMAVTSDGKLYGWGWNKFGQVGAGDNVDHCSPVQRIVQISCGWRHTLAATERKNIFSWGRGTNGQLGDGSSIDRNIPGMIDALSVDGSGCQQIESSKVQSLSDKMWISPAERYAIVPNETLEGQTLVPGQTSVPVKGKGNDLSVPENDVKRIRV